MSPLVIVDAQAAMTESPEMLSYRAPSNPISHGQVVPGHTPAWRLPMITAWPAKVAGRFAAYLRYRALAELVPDRLSARASLTYRDVWPVLAAAPPCGVRFAVNSNTHYAGTTDRSMYQKAGKQLPSPRIKEPHNVSQRLYESGAGYNRNQC